MSKVTYASVVKRAARLGLYVDALGDHPDRDRKYWLVATGNWQTTTPGQDLAGISAQLDERESRDAP